MGKDEDWHQRVLEARKKFERRVMGPHPAVRLTKKDLERVRNRLFRQVVGITGEKRGIVKDESNKPKG